MVEGEVAKKEDRFQPKNYSVFNPLVSGVASKMTKPDKPKLLCPKCDRESVYLRTMRDGQLSIICPISHRSIIEAPDGWKQDVKPFRPSKRGF